MKRILAFASMFILLSCFVECLSPVGAEFEDERIKSSMKEVQDLVGKAAKFFFENSLALSCREFEKGLEWRRGDKYIFIFDNNGTCYLDGDGSDAIWHKFGKRPTTTTNEQKLLQTEAERLEESEVYSKGRDISKRGLFFIDEMLEKGKEGGWVSFEWNNAPKYAYVKTVEKDGIRYIVGSGFYPDSVQFAVEQLVKGSIYYGEKYGAGELFRQINNPQGSFVVGDLYLWAYDFKGNSFAHGRNIAYVGQNRLDWRDSRGRPRNRIIIDLVRRQGHGWIEYDEDGILKRAYVQSFVDPRTGVPYIIGGGYYPTVNDDMVRNFVERGINYIKAHGADIAFRDFSSYAGKFIEGPLHLFAYKGSVMVADSENPIFIGQDLFNARDSEGKYIVREIMKIADTAGSGWLTILDKHAYRAVYVKKVEVPDGTFIVGSGYWPMSKEHTARALTEKASAHLSEHQLDESLKEFTSSGYEFIIGDLWVKVYSADGFCLAAGSDKDRIWHDEKKHLDEKGYPVFDKIKAVARQGGGWVEYPFYGPMFRAYVRLVEKPIVLSEKLPSLKIEEPAAKMTPTAEGGFGAWPSWTEQWKTGQMKSVPSSWMQLWSGTPQEGGKNSVADDKTKLSFGTLKVTEEEPEVAQKTIDSYIISVGYYI